MNGKIDIRHAAFDDLDALVRLNAFVQGRHAEMRPDMFRAVGAGDVRAVIEAMLVQAETRVWLAVAPDGHAVGYLITRHWTRPGNAFCKDRNEVEIDQLVVDPACRRRGVGSTLLRHARAWAAEHGVTRVVLDVWTANADAVSFYERAGFAGFRQGMEWAAPEEAE